MKIASLGFDLKKSSISKSIKVQSQLKQSNRSISSELAVPSAKLLQTYNKLSFKGDSSQNFDFSTLTAKSNYQVYRTMFPAFNSFKNGVMGNQKFADLFNGYTVDEIVTLFDEVIANQQEQNFSKLVHAGKNLPELSRNLSFKEAKDLTLNGILKNADIQNYLTLVDDNDYSPEIALSAIKYGLSQKDIIRLKELSNRLFNDNRKLSQEEAITCIAYGFKETEQVQSFIDRLEKDYSGNKLDLFEAALCTVHNLDTATTERFFKLKSMQLPYKKEDGTDDVYTLSAQEAVLCAKAELDEDELKRYAELKNKPFMYTAVRDNNSAKAPSTELIIAYIKDKQSDEEIAELAKYGFKNFQEYRDFQEILKVLGYESLYDLEKREIRNLVYIAKLQDKDGNNVFKDKNGRFDFEKFDMEIFNYIAEEKLEASQIQDYLKILSDLKNKISFFQDKRIIAIKLSSLQNNNGKNVFYDENSGLNIKDFKIRSLAEIAYQKLTQSQIKDYMRIFSNIHEPYFSGILSCLDEETKNSYKDQNGNYTFKKFSSKELEIIASFNLKKNELEDFLKIESIISSQIQEKSYQPIKSEFIVFLVRCLDENGENIFKDENNNFIFQNMDLSSIEYYLNFSSLSLQPSEIKDYLKIAYSLQNIENYNKRMQLAIKISMLPEKIKNTFKNDNGNFDFENYDLTAIEQMIFTKNEEIKSKLLDSNIYRFISQFVLAHNISDASDILEKLQEKLLLLEECDLQYYSMMLKENALIIILSRMDNKEICASDSNDINSDSNNVVLIIERSQNLSKETGSIETDYKKILAAFKEKKDGDNCEDNFLALEMATSEKIKNTYKNEKGEFDFSKYYFKELQIIVDKQLTKSQFEDFVKLLFVLSDLQNDKNNKIDIYDVASKIAKLQDNNGSNIFKNQNGEFDFGKIDIYSLINLDLTEKQCQKYRYLTSTLAIAPENAIYIAQDEELMERFKLIDPNIFWQGATGEPKEVFELFDSVLSANGIMGNRLQEKDFDLELPKDCSFKFGTLRYSPTDSNQEGFNVELQKANKNSTPIMIVKNKNGEKESYIAYDGAIALFRELRMLTEDENGTLKEDLSSHPHFSEEEINALSEAARHFIIDIIQENGECIISKGIDGIEKAEPFIGKELDTDTTKEKFKEIFQKLHNDSSSPNITIENILRLMPKDAIIQIRPYTTKTNSSHEMLYSISAEWHDSNGKKWDLRVHSHDLMYLDTNKHWIYRLGCQGEFYKPETNEFISQNTKKNKRDTHVLIESPENYENKLISNPYFQKTIRDISISFNKTQLIDSVSSELNIHTDDKEQKKNEIIAKCQQNAGYYYKYKKVIDNLLKEKGLFPLSSAA